MTHRLAVMLVATMLAPTTGCTPSDTDMDDLAERYVKLVLALGVHDSSSFS